jgi:thiamine phosphate synthase YjbQ (UPF0047 family)
MSAAISERIGMLQFADTLRIATAGRGLVEITRVVVDWVPRQVRIAFCQHTSAGLLIQENAARDVRADLETFLERIAAEEAGRYRHADKGDDDMPAHIERAARHPDHRRRARVGNLARHYIYSSIDARRKDARSRCI